MKCRNCNKDYPSKFYFVDNNSLSVCIYCEDMLDNYKESVESDTNAKIEKEKNLSIFINNVLKIPKVKRIRLLKNYYTFFLIILFFVIYSTFNFLFRIPLINNLGYIGFSVISIIIYIIILSPFHFIYSRINYSGISNLILILSELDFVNQFNIKTISDVTKSKNSNILKFLKKRKIFESKIINNHLYIYLRNNIFQPLILKLPTDKNQIEISDNLSINVIGEFDSQIKRNIQTLTEIFLYKSQINDYGFFEDIKKHKIKIFIYKLIN